MTLDTSKRFRFIEIRQSICRGQSVRRKPVRFHDPSLNDFIEDWKPEKKNDDQKSGKFYFLKNWFLIKKTLALDSKDQSRGWHTIVCGVKLNVKRSFIDIKKSIHIESTWKTSKDKNYRRCAFIMPGKVL